MDLNKLLKMLERVKYPLLILVIGLLILLIPSRAAKAEEEETDPAISRILSRAESFGETVVLVTEHGVVVVCEGAGDAAVNLDILRAVGSYTGFGSDKITILRMADH